MDNNYTNNEDNINDNNTPNTISTTNIDQTNTENQQNNNTESSNVNTYNLSSSEQFTDVSSIRSGSIYDPTYSSTTASPRSVFIRDIDIQYSIVNDRGIDVNDNVETENFDIDLSRTNDADYGIGESNIEYHVQSPVSQYTYFESNLTDDMISLLHGILYRLIQDRDNNAPEYNNKVNYYCNFLKAVRAYKSLKRELRCD